MLRISSSEGRVEIMSRQEDQAVYSIGAVARMLDIPTSTLRAWEERYAVVVPTRSSGGHRLYSRGQVDQLRYLQNLIDSGLHAAEAHRVLALRLAAGAVQQYQLKDAATASKTYKAMLDDYRRVVAAAADDGVSVSAWMTNAARRASSNSAIALDSATISAN